MGFLHIKTLAVAFAVAAAISLTLGAVSATAAGQPACGATITQDTTFTSNLSCAGGVGLMITASGVTVDLAGHKLLGNGLGGTGIVVVGAANVTIKNGTITGFGGGIVVQYEKNSGLTIQTMRITQNLGNGINIAGLQNRDIQVLDSQITSNGGDGIRTDYGTDAALYQNNDIENNGGNGMYVYFSTSSFVSNVISKNGANGIYIQDSTSFLPYYAFQDNHADKNSALGIYLAVIFADEGYVVDDRGGNVATKNGNPLQCVVPGLVCDGKPSKSSSPSPPTARTHPHP